MSDHDALRCVIFGHHVYIPGKFQCAVLQLMYFRAQTNNIKIFFSDHYQTLVLGDIEILQRQYNMRKYSYIHDIPCM